MTLWIVVGVLVLILMTNLLLVLAVCQISGDIERVGEIEGEKLDVLVQVRDLLEEKSDES